VFKDLKDLKEDKEFHQQVLRALQA
jgi:hypothetical protein